MVAAVVAAAEVRNDSGDSGSDTDCQWELADAVQETGWMVGDWEDAEVDMDTQPWSPVIIAF